MVTHLGMFDVIREKPVRAARSIPLDHERDQPSKSPLSSKNHSLENPHVIRLLVCSEDKQVELAQIQLKPGTSDELTLLSIYTFIRACSARTRTDLRASDKSTPGCGWRSFS